MSVLKNLRHISRFEYDYNYIKFYNDFSQRVAKTPQRRFLFEVKPLLEAINTAFNSVTELNQYMYLKNKAGRDIKKQKVEHAISDIYRIQKPLLVYQNLEHMKVKSQNVLCDYLNEEVRLLSSIIGNNQNIDIFFPIEWDKVNEMQFLKTMTELHSYTHSKANRASNKLNTTTLDILCHQVDKALYMVLSANRIYPQCYEEYYERKLKISNAVQLLENMSIPIMSCYNVMHYDEKIMREWIGLINKEIALLNGLSKSDSKQFSNLPKKEEIKET